MRAMNTQQAGVVDVVLSNHARGYTNSEMIAHRVAPVVDVPGRNMLLLKFGREGFRKLNTRRGELERAMRLCPNYRFLRNSASPIICADVSKVVFFFSSSCRCPIPLARRLVFA